MEHLDEHMCISTSSQKEKDGDALKENAVLLGLTGPGWPELQHYSRLGSKTQQRGGAGAKPDTGRATDGGIDGEPYLAQFEVAVQQNDWDRYEEAAHLILASSVILINSSGFI